MEERVGQVWDRWITKLAYQGHPEAAVQLDDVKAALGVFYRGLGGDSGLTISATTPTLHRARRNWLHRVAGTGSKVELAWYDERCLYLPQRLDVFPQADLNRELYFWLAALAGTPASAEVHRGMNWLVDNQQRCLQTLSLFPGLKPRYQRLVDAFTARRDPAELKHNGQAAVLSAIYQALRHPGSVTELPADDFAPDPVPLWLHPNPPRAEGLHSEDNGKDRDSSQGQSKAGEQRRRQAERVEKPEENGTTLGVRHEADLFSYAEFCQMDRGCEDEDDLDQAESIANDIDKMAVTQDSTPVASRIKFDLDLPSAQEDDIPLGEGIRYPEWDYKRQVMLPDYSCIVPMESRNAEACDLPGHLQATARRLRRQFEMLTNRSVRLRSQYDGDELDIDAYLQHRSARMTGRGDDGRLYSQKRQLQRDLSCLLLADLSLSTDAWVGTRNPGEDCQVIDVIRDSLYLFSESLHASEDQFAIHGFSSRRREHVRFNCLKDFGETYNDTVRGRIADISPGFYTRMGAAIRHASVLLAKQPAEKKLLLIVTDGKPNDLDRYEGRHGIEDTRKAIQEARSQGLVPFCITIDEQANQYLPYLFGRQGYTFIHRATELPKKLPQLYLKLTGKLLEH